MGLSAYPTPPGVGLVCMILFYAADLVSFFKNLFFSTLQILGIKVKSEEEEEEEEQQNYSHTSSSGSADSESSFKKMMINHEVMKYSSLRRSKKHQEEECSICLTEFEANSMINQLTNCGHFFHSHCLDKILRHWYITCPLCRTQFALQEQEKCTYSN